MLLNYINIAFRNLLKNRLHTAINILGLSLGIASVFLITLYIRHELSYDRFHAGAEDLYRIAWVTNNPQTRTPHPMAQALVSDFPEVESAVSLTPLWAAGLNRATHAFRNPQRAERYDERNILAVDTTFFDVFDFPLVRGDAKTALQSVNGLLISESMAKKYFGDEDPMGKQLLVDSDSYMVEVVGVFKDVPANAHFHFDFLVSYLREKSLDDDDEYYSWADFGHFNYLKLRPGTDAKALEARLMEWSRKYIDWSEKNLQYFAANDLGFKLQPVTDIHLHSRLRWELEPNGNIEYIYILAIAAVLTLVIACVNFMNLTTARSAERAREIGVRKTLGAYRTQLAVQFLAESVVLALIAIAVSALIIECSLPFFNYATGLSFQLRYEKHLPMLLALGTGIGMLAGIYPALYLSGIKPSLVLKGKLLGPGGAGLRKTLVVFQFAISMVLISAAAIIFNQLEFLRNKNLGFEKEEVIVIPLRNENNTGSFQTLQTELLKINGVSAVSGATNIPGTQFDQNPVATTDRPEDDIDVSEAFVDYDFLQALDIKLTQGRFFLRENASESLRAFVINETAARQLYPEGSPIGKELVWEYDEGQSARGTVIGVVQDFHFQSLHEPIRPLLLSLASKNFNYVVIRTSLENLDAKLAAIEKVYRHFEPVFPFEFAFLEDHLNQQYTSEVRTGNIMAAFSVIAIFIACIGLFGMSMLTFQHKVKEVSVRKVLGATPLHLLVLLLGNFTRLVVIAVIVSTPFAWWMMDRWLENFSYQINISPVVFVAVGLVLVVISWITLSYFTVRAARLNPAETLKNE